MTRLILIRVGAALLLGLGLLSGVAEPVQAQTTNHECARRAVRSGLILPLGTILARVRRRVRGRLVGVTLGGCRGGPWIYRIRMLTDNGRIAVIRANARTGQILGVRGAGRIYNNAPQYRAPQNFRRAKPWYRRRRR
ncbi:MAG: PepSY domain-containing protein [Alphaproteobacteria bacterium]